MDNDHSSLADLDEEFEAAEVHEQKEFEDVPDGKYQVRVEKVELTKTKERGVNVLRWQLRIISGSHEGQMIFHQNLIESKENVAWLKTYLKITGLELAKLSQLPDHLEDLLDVTLEVTTRKKGDFVNCYFNRRIEVAEAPETPADEVPF